MRLGLIARAALFGAVIAGAALATVAAVAVPHARRAALERERDRLAVAAHALAEAFAADPASAGSAGGRIAVDARAAGVRYTVVGADDRVVAESGPLGERSMDEHGHRPEVASARSAGTARTRRFSRTLGREMEYAAERVGDSLVVVRAARSADEMDAEASAAGGLDPLTVAVALALGALLGGIGAWPRERTLRFLREGLRAFPSPSASAPRPVPASLRDVVAAWEEASERGARSLAAHEAETARLESLLHGMPEAMLAVDHEERVQFVNATARAMLRVPEGEAVEGKPFHLFVREPRVLHVLRAALRGGEPGEAEVAWGEAPPRLVRFHAAPVRGGGPGAFLMARDISALRRLERMRSDFVANVSHELRTPIAAIAGAAETLAEGGALADPEAGPRFVDTVRRQAERLRVLVDDLLTLSRLESAPETIERVPVDLAWVVRQSGEAMAARARENGVVLEVSAPRPVRVLGDPEALRRLVDNLVLNAVTYTPSGGRVSASLHVDDGRVTLEVSDTGIGIAPEHLDRIFERFYRVDKARSRAKGGTGLGLAIVKHSVNLHSGEIRVESRLGKGSVFRVSIPVAPDAPSREGD